MSIGMRKPLRQQSNFSRRYAGALPASPICYKIIDEYLGQLEPRFDRFHLRVLKSRLESLFGDQRYRFMFGNRSTVEDSISIV
jgi:hypothetical protein